MCTRSWILHVENELTRSSRNEGRHSRALNCGQLLIVKYPSDLYLSWKRELQLPGPRILLDLLNVMLSGLPQKLPFGFLGDEAKLAFRSQPDGISKLYTIRVRSR
jgi:hypothetical protein